MAEALRLGVELWVKAMASASLEGGLAILCVYALCRLLPQLNATVKSWFWRLVFIRIVLAFAVFNPLPLPLLPAAVSPVAMVRAGASSRHERAKVEASLTPGVAAPAAASAVKAEVHPAMWTRVMLAAWLFGVLVQALYLLRAYLRTRRLRATLRPCMRPQAEELLGRMALRAGLRRTPRLAMASGITSPQLLGMWRPLIILPETLVPSLPTKDLRLILAHELAHIQRADLAWLWLVGLVRLLLFFHPLVWLAQREWLMTQEMACDERVIGATPSAAGRYSRILLSLAAKPMPRVSGGLGMTDRSSSAFLALRRRLESIYATRRLLSSARGRAIIAVAAWAVVLSLPWHLTARADAQKPRPLTGVPLDFVAASGGTGALGWESFGDGSDFSIDPAVPYEGQASGRLSIRVPGYYGTVMQCVESPGLAGSRLRYSAVLRTQGVVTAALRGGGGAGLWARVDDADGRVLSFANMQDTALLGDHEWTPHEVEVEVPLEAKRVCFGLFLHGHGTTWLAGVSLALTRSEPEESAALLLPAPRNLDLAEGADATGMPLGWQALRTKGVAISVDEAEAFAGHGSVRLTTSGEDLGYGRLQQCADTSQLRGRRVTFSGLLKTAAVSGGRANLWMVVQGADTRPLVSDYMHDEDVVGTTEWQRYQLVLDVPGEAVKICYGVGLRGRGTVWGAGFALKDSGPQGSGSPRVTARQPEATAQNLNFEDGASASGSPVHWHGGGAGYSLSIDRDTVHNGHASAVIRSISPEVKDDTDFAKMYQCVDAKPFVGRRLRYSGFLRAAGVTSGWAGLWLRVEDAERATLAFDNSRDHAARGSTEWREFAASVPVGREAAQVCFGFHLEGPGAVWVDDLSLGTNAT